MANAKTSGALSGAASGAATGSAFGPWGTVIGGVVGGAIGYFGSKNPKAPTAAPFTPIDVQDEQRKAIAGNLANFDAAASLSTRTNDFNQSEATRLLEKAIPGFGNVQRSLMAKVNQDLNSDTDLPQDVRDKIAQFAGEKGVSRGTAGGFNSFNLVKDFGFNLLDWKQASRARALNTLSTVYGMTPRVNVMSPMASMVDPSTAINVAQVNNTQRYNIDQSLINAQTAFQNDQIAAQNGALSGALSAIGGMFGTQSKVQAPPPSIAKPTPSTGYGSTALQFGRYGR